jgi:4-diphosphocytidyl-2C-methyl-D-erythritol kinase
MHVLDLDNDGLISAAELTDALRFLRANLDEEDLVALLDRWGADSPVCLLRKTACRLCCTSCMGQVQLPDLRRMLPWAAALKEGGSSNNRTGH